MSENDILNLLNSTETDVVSGLMALHFFFEAALGLNPSLPHEFPSFLRVLQETLAPVNQAYPNPLHNLERIIKTIGNEVLVGGTPGWTGPDVVPMTEAQVHSAMTALAQLGQGKLPSDFNMFTQYLVNQATQVNFVDALTYTAEASTQQITQGIQEVGENIIETGQNVLKYKNYLLLGAFALAAYVFYERYAGGKKSSHSPAPEVKANPEREEPVKAAKKIQGLLLPLQHFPTKQSVRKWAREHDFKHQKIRRGGSFWHVEQIPASHFLAGSYTTFPFTKGKGRKNKLHPLGIKARYARLKPSHYL